jgi:hypothetical protein
MKNAILITSLGVILFGSCGPPSENNSNSNIMKKHNVNTKNDNTSNESQDALIVRNCDNPTSHQYTLDSAAILIANFAKSDKAKKFVKRHGLGNYMSFEDLYNIFNKSTETTNGGLFFYDCFDQEDAFFAIRPGKNCYKNYRSEYAINLEAEDYHITSLYYSYWSLFPKLIDQSDVLNYLRNQKNDTERLHRTNPEMTGNEVRFANNELVAELGGENHHTSHGYSFFNQADFDILRNQENAVGVAIFRGLEYIEKNNVINEYDRIILIAVNSSGRFIHEGTILERSWPPKRLLDGDPN